MAYIPVRGLISSANSSTDTLLSDAVFTGTAEDVSNYSTITVAVDSDVDSASKGVSLEFSTDGSNWDRKKQLDLDTSVGSGSVHTLEVVMQYFRVVYTNGASAQSHFRLQTIYHTTRSGFITASPDEIISRINDAQIMRVSNDVLLDINRGLYADKFTFGRFAYNSAISNGSFSDVWSYGPTLAKYPWPTTVEKFRVQAGGNVNDKSDGSGARTIEFTFLNHNGNQVTEEISTAGSDASEVTSGSGQRFIRAKITSTGSIVGENVADILIENLNSSQIVGHIASGIGQTEMSMYTIPAGHVGYLVRLHFDVTAKTGKDIDLIMWQRTNALNTSAPFGGKRLVARWAEVVGHEDIGYKAFRSFGSLTDIWFEGKGNSDSPEIDIEYDLVVVQETGLLTPQ